MGKSTISMAIFNSYFDITRGYHPQAFHCFPHKTCPPLDHFGFPPATKDGWWLPTEGGRMSWEPLGTSSRVGVLAVRGRLVSCFFVPPPKPLEKPMENGRTWWILPRKISKIWGFHGICSWLGCCRSLDNSNLGHHLGKLSNTWNVQGNLGRDWSMGIWLMEIVGYSGYNRQCLLTNNIWKAAWANVMKNMSKLTGTCSLYELGNKFIIIRLLEGNK
jgi:hypothetical protein